MQYSITNIVHTIVFDSYIWLPAVSKSFPYVEFDRKRFAAGTMRYSIHKNEPACFAFRQRPLRRNRIFKCPSQVFVNVLQLINDLERCFFPQKFNIKSISVENICAVTTALKKYNISKLFELLVKVHGVRSNYDKETFPGLVYRKGGSKQTALIFTLVSA